jgi:hypothetical protein
MSVNWEIVLAAAFAAIGVLEFIKGFFPTATGKAWRILQPILCIGFSGIALVAPPWIMTGILALALSQVGYETIIETVKKKVLK